jgi:hypothetical protein
MSTAKENFCAENFDNCVRVRIPFTEANSVKRTDVLNGMFKVVAKEFIERCSQYKKPNEWYIKFKNNFISNSIFEKQIEINNKDYVIEPPLDEYYYAVFKIIWLPPNFKQMNSVVNHLCANIGKCIYANEFKDNDDIGTGKYNIKIKYPRHKDINFYQLTGKQLIGTELVFIIKYGDGTRCTYCEKFGHEKKSCEVFKMKCKTCGKRGHIVCSYANKASSEAPDYIDDNENNKMNNGVETNELNNDAENNELINRTE